MIVALLIYVLVCMHFALFRRYDLLIVLIVAAGLLQGPLVSISKNESYQYIDDLPVLVLIIAALYCAFLSRAKPDLRAIFFFVILALLVAFALIRSPDLGAGLLQARQVMLPIGLVFAGFVLRDRIAWRTVFVGTLSLVLVAAIWTLAEELIQSPLLDPTWHYLQSGGQASSLRQGLPPAYYADGVGGETVFRPGGPFMNPPVLGFLLGLGALMAKQALAKHHLMRVSVYIVLGLALFAAYARAGIVLFLVFTVIYTLWSKLGRGTGIAIGILIGGYLISTFIEQGNTSSHSEGLLDGLLTGISSPLGIGFGTTGYQASLEGLLTDGVAESLLGLYFAWLGWPMIIAVVVLLFVVVKRLLCVDRTASLFLWLAAGTVLTAASSESASSMSSTPVLWLLTGFALSSSSLSFERKEVKAQTSQLSARSRVPTVNDKVREKTGTGTEMALKM